jgi:protein-L-isoaspartate(D-aspartate) O-methyltransferase
MSWEFVLSEDDYRLFRNNISLLEERVVQNFPDSYRNPAILSAIRSVPRHLFVNPGYKFLAYSDNALPTSGGLTTSAPSVIARMILQAGVAKGDRVLEIGTGTGYQAAVLAEMGVKVCTVEIDRPVAETANRVLAQLGYKIDKRSKAGRKRYLEIRSYFPRREPIEQFWGNGRNGLAERSPFDGIIVAASVPHLQHVRSLVGQLSAAGGRLVVPVGDRLDQTLHTIERKGSRIVCDWLEGVSFQFLRLVAGEDTP